MSAITALTQAIEHMNKPAAPVDYQALAAAITTALEPLAKRSEIPTNTTIKLGNFGNSQTSQAKKASPKLEFAIQWLQQNPSDMLVSGRELEQRVTMNGETISYKWWNEAKKLTADGN